MVTTAIEKECKRSIQLRQIQHIADHEIRRDSGGLSALFRSLHGQRRHVDAGYLKAARANVAGIGPLTTREK